MTNLVLLFPKQRVKCQALFKDTQSHMVEFFSFPKILAEMYLDNFLKYMLLCLENRQSCSLHSPWNILYLIKITETENIV